MALSAGEDDPSELMIIKAEKQALIYDAPKRRNAL